ncbi:MAG: UDP-2,3-diacylglucosamine diphosphatase [Gammaproteobacteria bacterium]|nr:UDP-2,3-diacylglucosamine diphosphatase [Gammaproteobacteria bacterium]|tara:strand:- start:455 stop:1177 length:723 start_codon:yes stop_codon:yes gene_type:complete
MTTLFISDLHLDASKPEIGDQFLMFLKDETRNADALYILGDLFEVWLGDDDPNPYYDYIKKALYKVTKVGIPVFFMRGNRDFLVGEIFSKETGIKILQDPTLIRLNNQDLLLTHGDTLCTDDIRYQEMRKIIRDPEWQAMMLAKPIEMRSVFANQARKNSKIHNNTTNVEIMDVNEDAVKSIMNKFETSLLLHGHTHRPAIHNVNLGSHHATRIVLGDWFEQGSVVRWDKDGPHLETMPR